MQTCHLPHSSRCSPHRSSLRSDSLRVGGRSGGQPSSSPRGKGLFSFYLHPTLVASPVKWAGLLSLTSFPCLLG
jgi:hypothetical protein